MGQTTAQAIKCFELCCELTGKYRSINLVSIDSRSSNVVILAGEEIVIEIRSNGEWRFI
ncbi:DUF6888 family protein [Chamaesiphon sp. VAR_48_metabat_403]|uniref:DUF6888 family protein n=1 Tax=Chamaesiphon sp. VAR_48_metabat_403 TaxID=2964700 RepID=UPI0037BFE5CE